MVKVDLVSGFLGAGKTTLIKKFLKDHIDEKIVLIENEFGQTGIDGDLIKKEGFDVVEITSGCICCTMKIDFKDSFNKILQEFSPHRIIIEPTGINILSEILTILKENEFKGNLKINSIITVIDGANYLEHIEMFGEFFKDQIVNASTLIISKVEQIDDETLDKVIYSLKELNSKALIIESSWEELNSVDIDNLFNGEIDFKFEDLFHEEFVSNSNTQFNTVSLTTLKKFTEQQLKESLEKLTEEKHGIVLRAKGFLKGEKHCLEFSYANGKYDICESTYDSIGKVCVIGMGLNSKEIKSLFKDKLQLKRPGGL